MSADPRAALAARIGREYAESWGTQTEARAGAARRQRALEALVSQGLPSSRDENWKYANLRPLERARFAAPRLEPSRDALIATLPPAIAGYARYTFIDGVRLEDAGGDSKTASPGLLNSLASESGRRALADLDSIADAGPDTRFALLNEAFAPDGALIRVPASAAGVARIELVFVSVAAAQAGASHPRVLVRLEPGARLDLIERHLSSGSGSGFVNSAVQVALEAGATLNHYRVQQLGARAVWFDTLSAELASRATYRAYCASLGAQSARSTLQVRLGGEGAQLALHAVSVGDRQQVLDGYARVEHAAPATRTEETFRGIAAGRARVAFNGKIVVRAGAHKTDSSQSLRGLLAGPEAEIDVRPQLEIHTDDVRCSHGATAGKLDEAMLFYLLTRGLEPDAAQRLLKWAFLEDVVARIEIVELRRQIEASLAGQMHEADALQELL
ncbi:MAG TPA: Fe-S cluster assembly protein SufD [Steroidobacteraceae bacterium]|nr:Fe-S cluster assembly protein SufD [Steroidobacteraceae bacterium]